MGNEKQKVLEMVAEGRITPEEGVRLIEALGHAEGRGGGGSSYSHSVFGRRPFGIDIPEIRIPKIDLGNLGDMYVELKNTIVDTAKKAQGQVNNSKAGKIFEFKDYPIEFDNPQKAKSVELNIDVRAGKLKLKGGDVGDSIAIGKIKRVPEEPVLTNEFAGGKAKVSLKHSLGRCGMRINEDLNWSIRLNNAAADSRLSLEDVSVEALHLDNNAGNVDLAFGDQCDHVKLHMENNAGNVHLRIPEDFALRVTVSGNLSSNNLDRLPISFFDGVGTSPDWETSRRRFELVLNQNVANFTLEWKKPLKVDADAVHVSKGHASQDDDDDLM